jgi:polynucleotide 5'-hydroxyl-kinase GRC3/NOL9
MGKSAKAVPSVCYLDLDSSNPEYTPHGQVALTSVQELNLGPSFTHPATFHGVQGTNRTLAAHPLPTRNLVDYEDYFTSCIFDLFESYKTLPPEEGTRPLIINTPATLYTTNFPLLQSILKLTKPNHIVHFGDITAIDTDTALRLDSLQTLAQTTNTTLHELAAQFPPLPPSRTESELRTMQMQSYFHLDSNVQHETTWDARLLSHVTPWEFCYEETATRSQDLIGILPLFEPLPSSQFLTALNGSIVHIVETSCPKTQALYQNLQRTPQHSIPYFAPNTATGMTGPLEPQTSRLVCTALIRGFDLEAKLMQVVVPTTHESLLRTLTPETTVFVAGCCDTPDWAYAEDAYEQLEAQTSNMQVGGRFMGEGVLMEAVNMPPWVEKKSVMEGMGYLNTVRRVRKFLG